MSNLAMSFTHCTPMPDVRALARRNPDPIAWAIAGAVWSGLEHGMAGEALVRGLSADDREALATWCFAPVRFADLGEHTAGRQPDRYDEFDELLALLLTHARDDTTTVRWLAHAFATACMYENHLWQDLHLPARAVLSDLFTSCFPTLAARNTGNMKWKKFLYKQLCEAADTPQCRAPSCSVCSDYAACFGPEDTARPADTPASSIPARIPVRAQH